VRADGDPLAPPRRYVDSGSPEWQAFLHDTQMALAAQQVEDIAFAREAGTLVVEGPWNDAPAIEVAYVGIAAGQRVPLKQVARSWRYEPAVIEIGGRPVRTIVQKPIAIRIELVGDVSGAIIRRPYGNSPVQSTGLIDGKDFYFRSRGEHWSMGVGGDDPVVKPEWHYEEPYGVWPEAGRITEDEAYSFIVKAVVLYRLGTPTMTKKTVDAGTASIMMAIGAHNDIDQK